MTLINALYKNGDATNLRYDPANFESAYVPS